MTKDKKPKSKPEPTKRLTEQAIVGMGEIFPGFGQWYRETHDADGKHAGEDMPGLKPVKDDKPLGDVEFVQDGKRYKGIIQSVEDDA